MSCSPTPRPQQGVGLAQNQRRETPSPLLRRHGVRAGRPHAPDWLVFIQSSSPALALPALYFFTISFFCGGYLPAAASPVPKTGDATPAGLNRVKNPGFEEGDKAPTHWDRPDGLTSFWEPDPKRGGKCIRLCSSVHNDDFHRRLEEMKLADPPPPKPSRPFKPPGYDTVGGNDGVSYWSDWIDCKPGMRYAFSADVRSEGGTPKIFVKGYSEIPCEIDDNGKAKKVLLRRVTYKIYLDCAPGKGGDWKTSTIAFCPTHEREDVKWLRVMLFAYWPPQHYWFDNVRLVESGPDAEAPKRWAARKAQAAAEAEAARERPRREAKAVLDHIRQAIARYQKDLGARPASLADLRQDPGDPKWLGPYLLELGLDPWGNSYRYAPTKDGFTLKSLGPDGEEGGGDDVEG
jgi:hypothetical protein